MQYAENLERIAGGLVNNEVREDPVEKNIPSREISAAVTDEGIFGQSVKAIEDISHYAVGGLQTFSFQKVEPNGVQVEDGFFSELKRVQGISSLDSPGAQFSSRPACGALRPGHRLCPK